jgi:DNA (cytosine-5)-methyltransferase 1
MSWLYSQALVEEYLGENFSDGEQSAPSNGSHIPQAYCAPDKMTDFSRLSRFGMTFKPLTDAHGKALLTSYRAAFHAKTSQLQGGGAGIDGERSGMWREMARVICEVRPRHVFVENSPMLTSRGLGRVLGDLATMGFDARWGVLGAGDVGANHQRDRIWIVANSMRQRRTRSQVAKSATESRPWSDQQFAGLLEDSEKLAVPTNSGGGIHDGVAARVDRLKAGGNGQVPLCAATAWKILSV